MPKKSLRKLSIVAALFSAGFLSIGAVQATPTWAESYGVDSFGANGQFSDDPFYGSGTDLPTAMAKMPDGGFVVAGQIDFPEFYRTNFTHTSALAMGSLVRYAADGTILWQIELRQSNDTTQPVYNVFYPGVSHINQIATDPQGNIFMCGYKGGNGYNDGTIHAFVAKFSPAGALIWQNGMGAGSATVGTPPQTVPLGTGTTNYMSLTDDGGVVITLSQSRPNVGYTIPALAKFNADGSFAFSKAYENDIQYLGSTPVCQSKDGSRYVMAFLYATDGSALGSRYGLYLLVTDAAGNLIAQRGYNHSDNPGETPVAIIATADGGFATLSAPYADGNFGILRKFNADLSAETFEKRITITPGQARGVLGPHSLVETADGGFLIGGVTQDQNGSNPYDVMLMKLNSGGALQFVSLLGGPKNEGGPSSTGPSSAFAIELADGGYGLAATSASYHVGGSLNGGFSDKPDWWMAKTDSNRKVRNFKDLMLDQPLGTYTLTGSPVTGDNPTSFSAPGYPYGLSATNLPQFILEDLGAKAPPDLPTLIIQASSPRIVSPRQTEAVVQQHFAYHTVAAFFPDASLVTFSATGLPQGFTIDPTTGVISGFAPAGSETVNPIAITVQATDGTDTTSAVVSLTIGDGIPQFTVNGSDQPGTALANTVLTFSARYPGKAAGRLVTVQTANDAQGPWTDLDNGSSGYMTYEPVASTYVLGSTNYPAQPNVYFRAKVKAQAFADALSNVVGPFDLSSNTARAGKTLFRIKRNGLRGDFDFRTTQISAPAGLALRVQSTTTPGSEGSWANLKDPAGSALPNMTQNDATHCSLVTNKLTDSSGVYFRAIASGSGFTDSVSNLIGPYSFKQTVPPQVSIISPAGGGAGQSIANPLVITADSSGVAAINIHATATAGPNRAIASLSLLFDGETIYTVFSNSNSASVDYQRNTNLVGDHVLEVLAFDDFGVTGRAGTGPLYLRVVPAAPTGKAAGTNSSSGTASALNGKVYHVANSGGNWHDPATWKDANGNSGVPGLNDFAVVGSATVVVDDPTFNGVDVKSFSLDGGHLVGPSILGVTDMVTITGGSFDNNMNLHLYVSATCELLNADNLVFNEGSNGTGGLHNAGILNVHGAGGLKGVSDFTNHGVVNWQVPLLSSASAAALLSLNPRAISADVFHDFGKIAVQPLITNDGGSLIGNDGASLISNDGGSLISNDGASLIGNDGASLITNDGGSLITNDGGSLIGPNGGSLVTLPSAGLRAAKVQAAAASTDTGYIKQGGETDLSNLLIVGDVTLNGGILNGTGAIVGNLTNNGGYLMPGHSPGVITVSGNFTQGANGAMVIEAAGGEAGQFDLIQVGGSATLGGKLAFHTINGYVPLAGDPFNPIGYKTVSGAFSSMSGNANVTINNNGIIATLNRGTANPPTGQPVNISTRMEVQSGNNVLIGGFIIAGPGGTTKKVLIRGIGPSLSGAGLSGVLSDPLLELHKPDGSTVTNDNWGDAPNKDQLPNGFAPSNAKESIILADLAPGTYTVIEKGVQGATGIGLTEIYDMDSSTAVALVNISTRGFVDTGNNVMIGGFIVGGNEPAQILVRVTGPSLSGLSGVLADPMLELHDANGNVISNDDWRETQEAEIIATTVPPNDSHEPAILATLVPGTYTAIVRGKNNTTGIAVVEAYKIK